MVCFLSQKLLKEAHISGGMNWDKRKKVAFANDADNLVVTNRRYNRQKGALRFPKISEQICLYCDADPNAANQCRVFTLISAWLDPKTKL